MKVCVRHGGDPVPLSMFGKSKLSLDGHNSWCKKCVCNYYKQMYSVKRQKVLIGRQEINAKLPDVYNTRLWKNQIFSTSDGGYQNYMNQLR